MPLITYRGLVREVYQVILGSRMVLQINLCVAPVKGAPELPYLILC